MGNVPGQRAALCRRVGGRRVVESPDVGEDVSGVNLLPRDDVDRAVTPEGSPVGDLRDWITLQSCVNVENIYLVSG